MGNRFHLKYFCEVTKQMKKQTIRKINSGKRENSIQNYVQVCNNRSYSALPPTSELKRFMASSQGQTCQKTQKHSYEL